jgi:glyoxylase-like metal-dependent hydrolase (beta-lactamase superfamily II)
MCNPLTPHLWFLACRSMHYNTGAFIANGEAALIDPGLFPDEFATLAQLLKEQRATPRWLILTHSHWDHIFGPEHFPGVPVIAQSRYLNEIETNAEGTHAEIAKWEQAKGIQRDAPFVIPRPTETFDFETSLTVGGLTLRLTHAPGHAADQLVIYHAETETLWASDILSDVEIPFVSHSLAAYEATLTRLNDWAIRVLVPGHGNATHDPVNVRARLTDDRAYLTELRAKVTQAVRSGESVEEAAAACAAMRYRYPEDNTLYHQLNVESAYLELGGLADPKRVGWNKDWNLE